MLLLEITARTLGNENVPVNLHHFFWRHTRTRVQVVHVLCDEQKLICVLGEFSNRRVRCIRLRVADTLSSFAVPFPNQFRIARECFGRCQLCRIKIPPVTVFAAKSWNTALSRNACACNDENTHRDWPANYANDANLLFRRRIIRVILRDSRVSPTPSRPDGLCFVLPASSSAA